MNIILDSGPIIKGFTHSSDDHYFTIPDVIREIKDSHSKLQLSQLQLQNNITIRLPSEEALNTVVAFSKLTGDYASLSAVDLKILALTLTLETELNNGNIQHLKTDPSKPVLQLGKSSTQKPKIDISGDADSIPIAEENELSLGINNENDPIENLIAEVKDLPIDDDEGWITPKSVSKKKAMKKITETMEATMESTIVPVACMTTDFAMQNVILQMKMKLLSTDGLRIKKVKNWVLRCHACFKVCHNMEKQFCPFCGNYSLIRTSVSVDANGNMTLYLKKNFQYNNRGTKFSMALPTGGRKNNELITREDQKEYQKAFANYNRNKNTLDPFDLDFIPMESSSKLKFMKPSIGNGRRNANEVRRKRK